MLTLPKLATPGRTRRVLTHLAVEAAVLLPLVIVYFLLVMHAMEDFLTDLHRGDLRYYAVASVGLLLGQSVILDGIAGRILTWLGHDRI